MWEEGKKVAMSCHASILWRKSYLRGQRLINHATIGSNPEAYIVSCNEEDGAFPIEIQPMYKDVHTLRKKKKRIKP